MIEFNMIEFIIYLAVALFGIFVVTPFLSAHERSFFKDEYSQFNKEMIRMLGSVICLIWPVMLPFLVIAIPIIALGWIIYPLPAKTFMTMEKLFEPKPTPVNPKPEPIINDNASYRENAKMP